MRKEEIKRNKKQTFFIRKGSTLCDLQFLTSLKEQALANQLTPLVKIDAALKKWPNLRQWKTPTGLPPLFLRLEKKPYVNFTKRFHFGSKQSLPKEMIERRNDSRGGRIIRPFLAVKIQTFRPITLEKENATLFATSPQNPLKVTSVIYKKDPRKVNSHFVTEAHF